MIIQAGSNKEHQEKKMVKIVTVILSLILCQSSFAENYESIDHIKDVTKIFLLRNINIDHEDNIEIKVNPVNSALQLPTCSKDIEARFPENTNKDQATGVELSCNSGNTWHILVPVEVIVNTKILVAKQNILPKETIKEDDLDYATYDKNHLYTGYFKNKDEVVGQVASHLITAGMVITKKNIQQPNIIHRNEVVNIISKNSSVSVSMQGIAKSDGSINTMIKVYNPSSKRLLDAIVVGPNKAEIVA